jgi:hypothetical protein
MAKVKNISPGPRTLQARVGKDGVETVTLQRGEERDVNILNPDDPVLKGMIDNRELLVDGGEEHLSDEEQEEFDAQRFANDTHQRIRREDATAAGHVPGLADPLPDDEEEEELDEEGKPKSRRSSKRRVKRAR